MSEIWSGMAKKFLLESSYMSAVRCHEISNRLNFGITCSHGHDGLWLMLAVNWSFQHILTWHLAFLTVTIPSKLA